MKIFISWSGDRSEALATALKDWLPLVLHYAEPWLSHSDIGAGDRWSVEIAKGLETCNFGIICITRENRDAPWILFEAGALAKSMQDGKVIPLLLGLDKKEISGPLAQFQAKKVDQGEVKELIFSLNKAAANPVPDGTLEKLFAMAWSDLDTKIAAIPEIRGAAKPSRPEGEILEELVSGVRNLENRLVVMKEVDTKNFEMQLMMLREEDAWRRRKGPKARAMELMAISRKVITDPEDPIHILFAASFLRDDAPWFYELALDTYRATKSGNQPEAVSSYKRLMDALKMLQAAPIFEEIGVDWKMISNMFGACFLAIEASAQAEPAESPSESDPALLALQNALETRRRKRNSAG